MSRCWGLQHVVRCQQGVLIGSTKPCMMPRALPARGVGVRASEQMSARGMSVCDTSSTGTGEWIELVDR